MSHAATIALNRARLLKPSVALSSANFSRSPVRAASASVSTANFVASESSINPSLANALRPAALNQWLMPYLAAMTPQYVEMLLRQALYGSHVAAMELFTVMIDSSPEIAACVQEWTEGVLQKRVVYDPYHEEDEEPSDTAIEKAKIVSAALRNMRPDATRDENGLTQTIKDIAFARFHGLSVLAVEWSDTYGDGSRFIRNVPNLGSVLCVRSTYWVHPVCYAMDTTGRLGLNIPQDRLAGASRDAKAAHATLFDDNLSFTVNDKSRITEFPKDNFLIAINKSKTGSVFGGSCLRPLAWWWLASNFCGDYLMKYAELFGIPLRKATYDPNTPDKVKREIRQLLQASGSEPWTMMPKGAEIEFERASGGGSDSPQAFLFNFANEMFRKVILHQTMSGGAKSQGTGVGKGGMESEMEGAKKDCVDAGAQFVQDVLNLQLVPSILTLNYGEDGDMEAPTIRLVDVEVGGVADAQRDQILAQTIDVPDSYLRRKYGVPKMGPNDKVAGVEVGTLGAQAAVAQQQHDDQMKQAEAASKAQADALAKQPKMQPAGDGEPLDKATQDDGSGVSAHQMDNLDALMAGDVAGHEFHGNQYADVKEAAMAATKSARTKEEHLAASELHKKAAAESGKTDSKVQNQHLAVAAAHRKVAKLVEKSGFATGLKSYGYNVTVEAKRAAIQASAALAETVNPMVARLKSISEIKDKAARIAAYKKFLEEQPNLVAQMKESATLADETEQIATAQFEKGLKV